MPYLNEYRSYLDIGYTRPSYIRVSFNILRDIIIERKHRMIASHYYTPKYLILDYNSYLIICSGINLDETRMEYIDQFMGMQVISLPVNYEVIEMTYDINEKSVSVGLAKKQRDGSE